MARPSEGLPHPLIASLIAFGSLLVATPSPATLFVHEPFDYAAPSILEGLGATGQNLSGAYTPVNAVNTLFKLRVSSPGLDYGELVGAPGARGHKVTQFGGTGPGDARIALAQPVAIDSGQAIFFSARFTFDDSSNGTHRASIALVDDGTLDEIAFGEPVGGIRALRVAAQTAATGGTLQAAGLDRAFENGQSLLLVGRYLNSPAAQGDVLEVIGYDTARANVLPPSYDAGDPNKAIHFRLDGIDRLNQDQPGASVPREVKPTISR
ncbi:MAG: hypothetical protein EHM59_18855 [Betaproteobacteria bacterium]|nr:MAG: hypothetical protein EHM59_18855 [Betaproteobacteria bacterium]